MLHEVDEAVTCVGNYPHFPPTSCSSIESHRVVFAVAAEEAARLTRVDQQLLANRSMALPENMVLLTSQRETQ
jgi:hypothetical protein